MAPDHDLKYAVSSTPFLGRCDLSRKTAALALTIICAALCLPAHVQASLVEKPETWGFYVLAGRKKYVKPRGLTYFSEEI